MRPPRNSAPPEANAPLNARVTMRDVAKAVGLSQTAVSLALRNNPQIPEARRLEIQEIAKKLGYTPNAAAISLAHFKRNSRSMPVQAALAWINPWPNPKRLRGYKEFDNYWEGASACAEKFGFRLEEFVMNKQMTPRRLEKVLLARGIPGILLPPLGTLPVDWGEFRWEGFSVVRFGRTNAAPRCHFVTSAQVANTIMAFDKMREYGYKRIGYVGKFHRNTTFGAAFLWIQRETPRSAWVEPFLYDAEERPEYAKDLLEWLKKEKPDAILTSVPDVPQILEKAGYDIPGDIAVAGTTVLDIPVSAGIDQRPREIGRVATLVMISLIHDNERGVPPAQREILVHGEWVDGASLPRKKV